MRRNNQHGSWPLANQELFAAPYECKLEWGEGNHSGTHGASVLPDNDPMDVGTAVGLGGGQEARGVGARL